MPLLFLPIMYYAKIEYTILLRGDFMDKKYETTLYRLWLNTRYRNKGEFCETWNRFSNFEAWANANGFQEGARLKRLNKTKPYSPTNCQFLIGKTEYNTELYRIWSKMMYHSKYNVCHEWRQFPNFEAWALSNGYEPGTKLFIERANKYDPYTGVYSYEWNPMCCKFRTKEL